MPKITYIESSGTEHAVDAEVGSTVMESAIKNSVPGIEAECGGACACATCHVYVEEEWREKTGGPSPMEEDMLDFGYDVRPSSRLSCQIKVTDALDGLVVRIPERQAEVPPPWGGPRTQLPRFRPRQRFLGQWPRAARLTVDHHHRGARGRGACPFVKDRLQEGERGAADFRNAGADLDLARPMQLLKETDVEPRQHRGGAGWAQRVA